MLFPIIGARLHGWLDDLVVLLYVAGALLLGLQGTARVIAFGGAAVHFLLTRLTAYPQGTIINAGTLKGFPLPPAMSSARRSRAPLDAIRLIPFRVHAFIELGEGIAVLAATLAVAWDQAVTARAFLVVMGASQFGAFAFSDYGPRAVPV